MVLKKQKLAAFVLGSFLFFPSVATVSYTFASVVAVVLLLLMDGDFKLDKYLIGKLGPLLCLLLLGFLFAYQHNVYDVFKDVWYLLKIILLIIFGYMLMRHIRSFNLLCLVIVAVGILAALEHLIQILLYASSLSISSLFYVREELGITGSMLSIVALVILLFCKRVVKLHPALYASALLLLFLSLLFSVSRTYFVVFIAMSMSMMGWQALKKKGLFWFVGLMSIVSLFFFLSSEPSRIVSKLENSSSEVTIHDYSDRKDINANWRGFEAYRALVTYESGTLINKLFGQGFGSLIDLGFVMTLGGQDMEMIPMTHNGYMYILVKFGIIGVFIYLFFIYKAIRISVRGGGMKQGGITLCRLVKGIGWVVFLTTFVISGPFNIFRLDGLMILFGALLFLINVSTQSKKVCFSP